MTAQNVIVKSDVNRYLYAMMGSLQLVDGWWHSPNKAFDLKTPDEIYQVDADGRKRVYEYVLGCSDGYW